MHQHSAIGISEKEEKKTCADMTRLGCLVSLYVSDILLSDEIWMLGQHICNGPALTWLCFTKRQLSNWKSWSALQSNRWNSAPEGQVSWFGLGKVRFKIVIVLFAIVWCHTVNHFKQVWRFEKEDLLSSDQTWTYIVSCIARDIGHMWPALCLVSTLVIDFDYAKW